MKRVLKELQLTHIAAVDRPCQEGALAMIMKRDNGMDKVAVDIAGRVAKRLLDHDDFDKAYDSIVDCMRDCDNGDALIVKFNQHEAAIAEIVSDQALTQLGKQEELIEGLSGFLQGLSKADVEQFGKALTTGDRLRKLGVRTNALLQKAQKLGRSPSLKDMHARLDAVHKRLKDVAA